MEGARARAGLAGIARAQNTCASSAINTPLTDSCAPASCATGRSHEATNRAVKALAVSRKYIQDGNQEGSEEYDLGFFPLNRTNDWGVEDPNLFGFLVSE